MKLTNSSPVDKVFNIIKVNKVSGLIRNGNGLQNPNQNPRMKKNICIIKLCPIKKLKTLFPLKLTNSSPVDKVFNFIKINEFLDLFGTEMGSRTRIKTRN